MGSLENPICKMYCDLMMQARSCTLLCVSFEFFNFSTKPPETSFSPFKYLLWLLQNKSERIDEKNADTWQVNSMIGWFWAARLETKWTCLCGKIILVLKKLLGHCFTSCEATLVKLRLLNWSVKSYNSSKMKCTHSASTGGHFRLNFFWFFPPN